MGKLILKEFKETAKYYFPVFIIAFIFSALFYFLTIHNGDLNLMLNSMFYDVPYSVRAFLTEHKILPPFHFNFDFSFLRIILIFSLPVLGVLAVLFRANNDLIKKGNLLDSPFKTVFVKLIPASLFFIVIRFLDYSIQSPAILWRLKNSPKEFEEPLYTISNPFIGGFNPELISIYIYNNILQILISVLIILIAFTGIFIGKEIEYPIAGAFFTFCVFGFVCFCLIMFSLWLSDIFSLSIQLTVKHSVSLLFYIFLIVLLFYICCFTCKKAFYK